MWNCTSYCCGGYFQFFSLVFGNESLKRYYKLNFALTKFHGYSLTELDNMIPWERDIYVAMLIQYIEEENQKIREQASKKR